MALSGSPVKVVVVPVPVIPPGLSVHMPVAGNPLRSTLPVETKQVGWVIVPTTGADGIVGCALTTALAEGAEKHPDAIFCTIKV